MKTPFALLYESAADPTEFVVTERSVRSKSEVTVTIPADTGETESPVPKSIVPAEPTKDPLSLMKRLDPPPPPPALIETLVIPVILPLASTVI